MAKNDEAPVTEWDDITADNYMEAGKYISGQLKLDPMLFENFMAVAKEENALGGNKKWKWTIPAVVRLISLRYEKPRPLRFIKEVLEGEFPTSGYRKEQQRLVKELDLDLPKAKISDYADFFLERLFEENMGDFESGAIQTLHDRAMEVSRKLEESDISKNPVSMAASAVYAASVIEDLGLTQEDVEEASKVSQQTIRKYWKNVAKEVVDNGTSQEEN